MYRIDRTKFTAGKAEEQFPGKYWKKKSPIERLEAAYYLISVAYDFDINNPPRMDKTKFSCHKLN